MSSSHPTTATASHDALQGRRIGVALAPDANYSPGPSLIAHGAQMIHYPCQERLPLDDYSELDQALKDLAAQKYNGLLLTTPDAVVTLVERLHELGIGTDRLNSTQIATFGADTQVVLQAQFGHVGATVAPSIADSPSDPRAFVQALAPAAGSHYLLLVPAGRAPDWPEYFDAHDAGVTIIPAYRAHMRRDGDDLPGMLWAGSIDAMAFVSADNVQYFATRLRHDGGTLAMLDHVPIACIDQSTADAAAKFGLRVQIIAPDPTPTALAQAIEAYFALQPVM